MSHQILSGLAAPCLHCGAQAHPCHVVGEWRMYCALHCVACAAEPLPERAVETTTGEQGGLFDGN